MLSTGWGANAVCSGWIRSEPGRLGSTDQTGSEKVYLEVLQDTGSLEVPQRRLGGSSEVQGRTLGILEHLLERMYGTLPLDLVTHTFHPPHGPRQVAWRIALGRPPA
eukprot:365262-Chlamydomonas_euryale.AAC.2